jgi:hypothetical protein
MSNDRSSIKPHVYLILRDEYLKLRSFLIIDVRCLNLNESLSHSYDLSLISKINIECDRHNQVLKGVN